MITGFILLPMLLMQCFMATLGMSQPNLTTDQYALLQFKAYITSDPSNIMSSNWSSSATSICNWVGVSCGAFHGRVTALNLPNMNLTGSLSPHLGNLSFLVSINLSGNNFNDHLPPELGKLKHLRFMDLSFNFLNGSMPDEIWLLSKLETFRLESNRLTGTISRNIGNLTKLRRIYIGDAKIRGEIPQEIGRCKKLQELALSTNRFIGNIPRGVGNLTKLTKIYLGDNNLEGEIPHEISNLHNLEELSISNASLSGEIPQEMGNPHSPHTIFNISTLEIISLPRNNLLGHLPSTFGLGLPKLTELYLNQNKLTGIFPSSISNSSQLTILALDDNLFSGTLPNSLGDLRFIKRLYLHDNMFSEFSTLERSFLTSLTNCRFLTLLSIALNSLNGILPTSIGNLSTSLQYLYAYNCKIQGNIPIEIGNLSNLITLSLYGNDLTGPIPTTIGRLQQLQGLYLGSNNLGSTIPSTFWSLKYILKVDLSSNSFIGPLSSDFGNLKVLINMNLSRNQLSGNLPNNIGDLKDLTYLSLAKNSLEGNIPQSFDGLVSLEFLDLSNNILSGVIPKSLEELSHLKFFNVSFNKLEGEIPSGGSFKNFSAQSFMGNTALCGLPTFQVPPWSFGSVYNGTLDGGRNIAIKVFNLQVEGVLESFDRECEVLGSFHHRNLVKIISSCCTEDFKALVLEFMPNETLEKWLYSDRCCLNVLQRLDIIIDVASALEYLHHGHSIPIIHCDLKPSNVLLDEDMVAHVGDFGLAKLLGEGESMMQTMQIATIGYMAPEYGSLGMVSTKGDVYSFGILVMETFTRRKPTDKMFFGEMSLKAWVNESLSHSRTEVVDANLMEKEEHFIAKANCVSSVLEVALNCCAETPKVRRNMMDVTSMLKKIKNQYLKDIGN
ncbi:hypothetical protein SLA2020_240690 [Shorea laevis]